MKLLLAGLFLLLTNVAQAIPVNVNPGAFTGQWRIDNTNQQLYTGPKTLDVLPGRHLMNIAGLAVYFNLAADGTTVSENPVAVNGGAGTLTFNTVPVQINPNLYLGTYNLPLITWNTQTNSFREIRDAVLLNLVPGLQYNVSIASTYSAVKFDLAANGTVTSLNPVSALGSANSLSFNNVTVTLDPDLFAGTFSVRNVQVRYFHGGTYAGNHNLGIQTGPMATVVVPGVTYLADVIGANSVRNRVAFDVNAAGAVTSSNPAKLTASGSTVRFVTAPVIVDPVQYIGAWEIYHATNNVSGKQTLDLVVDMPYLFSPNRSYSKFVIDVDVNGNVTSTKPTSFTSTGNVLTFKNTPVNINAGAFAPSWNLLGATTWQRYTGNATLILVPDLTYQVNVNGQAKPINNSFVVDATGNVTSLLPVSYAADGTSNTLTFNTVGIQLDTAGTYTGYMSFIDAFTYSAPTTFDVVPGLNYRLFTLGYSLDYLAIDVLPPFTVNADCSVSGFPAFLKGMGGASAGLTQDVSAWAWTCANTAPVANAGTAQTVEQTSPAGALVSLNGSASSDTDGDVLSYAWTGPFGLVTGVAPNVQFPAGTNNANLIVNDGTVDSALSSVIITVQDTTAPVVTAPAAVTIEATAVATPATIGTATATDAVAVVSISSNAPASYALGATSVIWTAVDAVGNSGSASQTVTIQDTTPPVLTVPTNVSVEANAVLSTVAIGTATATATDIFGATVTNNAPATFPLGVTTVTYTATDGNGLTATATQIITVTDNTVPVLTIPAAVSMEATGPQTAVVIGAATATDIFPVTVTSNAPATFPEGVTLVTWSATDANNNISTATQSVTITDLTAPVVTAPLAITVMAAGAAGTPATDSAIAALLAGATATDAVGVVGLITHNAPLTFPVGITSVTFSATDAAGNIGTAIATVTIVAPNPAVLTPAQIATLTAAQLAMLTPVQIAAIAGTLTPVQLATLTPAQKQALKQASKKDEHDSDSEDDDESKNASDDDNNDHKKDKKDNDD